MQNDSLAIETIVSEMLEENSYVVSRQGGSACCIVDPGLSPHHILAYLQKEKLEPAAILVTHAHYDHVGGVEELKRRWPDCPIVTSQREAEKMADPSGNLSAAFGLAMRAPKADRIVADKDVLTLADMTFEVREIPGHSSGHIVFLANDASPPVVFVGDVIFAGGVGRTDFPDGDAQALFSGIREKLFALDGATVLYPGHGPSTTVAVERRTNPYVGDPSA